MAIRFMNVNWCHFSQLKIPLAALLNFIQTYFLREIKLIFFHFSIRKSFYTGKNILPESRKYHLAFCLNIYDLWYNENIQVDKNSIYLVQFSEKNINYVSQHFRPDNSIKKWHELKGNPNFQVILNWIIQILHYYFRKQHKNS